MGSGAGRGQQSSGFKDSYEETGDACYAGEVKTPFATGKDIDQMKAMVADAKPDLVLDVADAWQKIHDKLVDGGGSVKTDFDKAVEHVLQHWEGESAEEFTKKARKVSKQISDCATYARYTSTAMRNAGHKLAEIKPQVDAIEKPGDVSSAMNSLGDGFSRDDSKWKGEIKGNQGAQKALDGHDDDLSAGKEEQLKAAAHMETLALTYSSQSKTMGSWQKKPRPGVTENDDYPGDPGGVAPAPVPVTPEGSGPSGSAVTVGRSGGVSSASPKADSTAALKGPHATATNVDGVSGGTAHAASRTGAGAGAGSGNIGAGIGSGGPGGAAGGGPGGVPGGPGMIGRASGNRAGTGPGAATGGRSTGGMGSGMGSGSGAGGKATGKEAGRGPLARQKGGALDTPETGKNASRQGGSSLHSSRGGAQAGQRGRNANGVLGGMGANAARRREEEDQRGRRPDYLVEDEETWVPKRRDVTPPTIE